MSTFRTILLTLILIAAFYPSRELRADSAAEDSPTAEEATLEDGERDWGRDPGIGTTLSTPSMVIAGAASAVVIGLVAWLVSYRKPDGTVHPYDEG